MAETWLIALATLVAALPLIREMGRRPIAARQRQPEGRMVRLSRGRTHIREDGPADGPPMVLVHGLTTPSFAFDGMVPGLVAQGFRVIRYDHYGRGRSDRPRIAQDAAAFRAHLQEVLDACGVAGPASLVGYSMGAAVVTDFAARHPERARRLVLLAPAGMQPVIAAPGLAGLLRLPLLGAWLFHMRYPTLLARGIDAERDLPGAVPGIADRQIEELRYRGFLRLVLASLRGMLAAPQEAAHRRIASLGVPVTAIFGAEDGVIPRAARDLLAGWNPDADLVTLDGAGHGLPYTHAQSVLAAL